MTSLVLQACLKQFQALDPLMRLHFTPIHVFRETPQVTFFDAYVQASNLTDLVKPRG
ncbi:MAG TPA: hypothetical protein QF700_00265 [Prochlorococcus sp.]|nr:hypothetical protein [Prochlorococcus sp.]